MRVGDKLPFFVYDTPYSARRTASATCFRSAKAPLVLVFMANFGHPITRTFASRYANTYAALRDGGFALVVRSRADKLSRSIGPNTLPYPLLLRRRAGVLYEHLNIPHEQQRPDDLLAGGLAHPARSENSQGYKPTKGADAAAAADPDSGSATARCCSATTAPA